MVDPPDLSPYAGDGGWNPSQSLPYEGNDNVGMTDYGICIDANCTGGAQTERVVTIGSDWTKKVYLKVPERYSGNNFQVEVIKTDYYGNSLSETKIASATSIYTTWKRVYIERDKMFRRGGLLYESGDEPSVIPVGSSSLKIMKGPNGVQLDNLNVGDKIAIFDAQRTYESPHDEAYIGSIDRTTYTDYALIMLKKSDLSTDYQTKYS
ncbi:MAG: hypothetical protein N2445_09415, partial [Acidobacteria bacterium]|nr:hypothetical protein [Acidobacteriota bacterium]